MIMKAISQKESLDIEMEDSGSCILINGYVMVEKKSIPDLIKALSDICVKDVKMQESCANEAHKLNNLG